MHKMLVNCSDIMGITGYVYLILTALKGEFQQIPGMI